MRNRIDRPIAGGASAAERPNVDAQEILERAATIIQRVRQDEAYAAFVRDQHTKASAIRSHDRRRLRSSANAGAARRFAGIAPRRASTA
jgi:hypothetical protein